MMRYDEVKKAALAFLLEKNPDYAPVGIAHTGYVACLSTGKRVDVSRQSARKLRRRLGLR